MEYNENFITRLTEQATQGDANAQQVLGASYYYGVDVPVDYEKAVYWIEKAYKQHCPLAITYLARCYMNGYGVNKNIEKAIELYHEAAKYEDAEGYFDLAECYDLGNGVAQDKDYAKQLFIQSAEHNFSGAYEIAGFIMLKEGNHKEAIKWFQKAVDDSEETADAAMFELGMYHLSGEYIEADQNKAVSFIRKSAELGYVDAMIYMGCLYQEGQLFEQDAKQALHWYRAAAMKCEEGDESAYIGIAYSELGFQYYYGYEVEQDYIKAVFWLEKAVASGEPEAKFLLGMCYYRGRGVTIDLKKAYTLLLESAEDGFARAQCEIGAWYFFALNNVDRDYEKAHYWISKAAEGNIPQAYFYLGYAYMDGYGVEQNYNKAIYWFEKAVDGNVEDAQEYLDECMKRIKCN